jgi:hypothetical protein
MRKKSYNLCRQGQFVRFLVLARHRNVGCNCNVSSGRISGLSLSDDFQSNVCFVAVCCIVVVVVVVVVTCG